MNSTNLLYILIGIEIIIALYFLYRRKYNSRNKHTEHYKEIRDQATKVEPEETRPEVEDDGHLASSLLCFVTPIFAFGIIFIIGIQVLRAVDEAIIINPSINETLSIQPVFSVVNTAIDLFPILVFIIVAMFLIHMLSSATDSNNKHKKVKPHRSKHIKHYTNIRDQATKIERRK